MNPLKIAVGVVLGLFCWNFLLALSEQQDRRARSERLDRAYEMADVECQKGDPEACAEKSRILLHKTEQLAEDMKRFSEP